MKALPMLEHTLRYSQGWRRARILKRHKSLLEYVVTFAVLFLLAFAWAWLALEVAR